MNEKVPEINRSVESIDWYNLDDNGVKSEVDRIIRSIDTKPNMSETEIITRMKEALKASGFPYNDTAITLGRPDAMVERMLMAIFHAQKSGRSISLSSRF